MSSNIQYQVHSLGQPLQAAEATKPELTSPDDVLILLKATAINPADCKMIDAGHRTTEWPIIPGLDGAGIVEAVGSNVSRFAAGDRVFAQFEAGPGRGGSYQKLATVKERMVAKMPKDWTFEEAASLSVCYFTALLGLGMGLKIPLTFIKDGPGTGFEPSSVLVLGGSSGVGASAIQLLHLALPGCRVIATASQKHHDRLVNVLNADGCIDRSSTSLAADVQAANSGKGVDAILDTVGAGATQRDVFNVLDPNGPRKYAQVWTGDDEIEAPKGVESILFRGRDLPQLPGHENVMQALEGAMESGRYKLPLPIKVVGKGLEGLKQGLELMREGVSGEKLVVTMG